MALLSEVCHWVGFEISEAHATPSLTLSLCLLLVDKMSTVLY